MGIYNRKDNCVENWQESVRTTQLSTHTRTHHPAVHAHAHAHKQQFSDCIKPLTAKGDDLTKPRKLLNPELSNET